MYICKLQFIYNNNFLHIWILTVQVTEMSAFVCVCLDHIRKNLFEILMMYLICNSKKNMETVHNAKQIKS